MVLLSFQFAVKEQEMEQEGGGREQEEEGGGVGEPAPSEGVEDGQYRQKQGGEEERQQY